MKVVVLGSNSFSGAQFVDYALRQGAEVIGMSRSPEPHDAFLPYRANPSASKSFRFLQYDLNHDLEKILSTVDEFEAEYFVNFAAQSMVAESWLHPEHWFQTNVVSNVKLHDGLRKRDFLKKYVHVSTPEVYGSTEGTISEHTNYNPSTPYAASRAAADLSLMTFFKNYGFPVVFTRAANVYGPGQQLYRIIPRTMLFARLQKPLELHGGGHSVRSFIHIEDVSEGTWLAMKDGKPGDIFHLSTREQVSIREVVERICRLMGVSFEKTVKVVGDRPGKDSAYLLGSAKAEAELGWPSRKSFCSLDQGLKETLTWIDQNLTELRSLPHGYIHKP